MADPPTMDNVHNDPTVHATKVRTVLLDESYTQQALTTLRTSSEAINAITSAKAILLKAPRIILIY